MGKRGEGRRWFSLGIGLASGLGRVLSTGRNEKLSRMVVEPVMCPNGHVLGQHLPGDVDAICTVCKVQSTNMMIMWGCGACEFFICDTCGRGDADWTVEDLHDKRALPDGCLAH